jgi:HD superfamily phosphodiesterase
MIPSDDQILKLWDTYDLPSRKRIHCSFVTRLSDFIAQKMREKNPELVLNTRCIHAAAMLHDIDKNVPKHEGETHPDAGVRVLKEQGMEEITHIVLTHPLHAILDQAICPRTLEEKIVFCADKMVKDDVIGLEKRFELWRNEAVPDEQQTIVCDALPLTKSLLHELEQLTGLDLNDIDQLRNFLK